MFEQEVSIFDRRGMCVSPSPPPPQQQQQQQQHQ